MTSLSRAQFAGQFPVEREAMDRRFRDQELDRRLAGFAIDQVGQRGGRLAFAVEAQRHFDAVAVEKAAAHHAAGQPVHLRRRHAGALQVFTFAYMEWFGDGGQDVGDVGVRLVADVDPLHRGGFESTALFYKICIHAFLATS
ncbi:hypothetical protein [Duganella sp. P38]|uniref:hypothetical protein n=1 Tax=Duganella sp. P38 TaxID=3423949 RepID=UPI003D79D6D3